MAVQNVPTRLVHPDTGGRLLWLLRAAIVLDLVVLTLLVVLPLR